MLSHGHPPYGYRLWLWRSSHQQRLLGYRLQDIHCNTLGVDVIDKRNNRTRIPEITDIDACSRSLEASDLPGLRSLSLSSALTFSVSALSRDLNGSKFLRFLITLSQTQHAGEPKCRQRKARVLLRLDAGEVRFANEVLEDRRRQAFEGLPAFTRRTVWLPDHRNCCASYVGKPPRGYLLAQEGRPQEGIS